MITDNEIIKALECCGNIVDSTCKECAYHETYNASCVVRLMRNALDLINRQKAEIERLQKEKFDSLNSQFAEMYETTLKIATKKAKSEAYKEFAERVKDKKVFLEDDERYVGYAVKEEDIDDTLKELMEKGR